jgi:hypothetical protein
MSPFSRRPKPDADVYFEPSILSLYSGGRVSRFIVVVGSNTSFWAAPRVNSPTMAAKQSSSPHIAYVLIRACTGCCRRSVAAVLHG